jgi:hypothetical protein
LRLVIVPLVAAMLAAGCASGGSGSSEREWQRAECNRVIDAEARERCFKRIDEDFGGSRAEPKPKEQPRR